MEKQIGLIGFGRIGSYLYKRCTENNRMNIEFVYDPDVEKTASIKKEKVLKDPQDIFGREVDLIVEAANSQVVANYAPRVLMDTDILILSVTALADDTLNQVLEKTAVKNGTKAYIPHGALLGMDGIYDARDTLDKIEIVTVKNPRNIDFDAVNDIHPDEIKESTVLYEGPTRGICDKYPRNVNAHAIVALAGIGFDRTKSKLIADPHSDDAVQHIIAEGQGTVLEIKRSSPIKGVTGEYTLASIYGSVERALTPPYGFNVL